MAHIYALAFCLLFAFLGNDTVHDPQQHGGASSQTIELHSTGCRVCPASDEMLAWTFTSSPRLATGEGGVVA